MKRALLFALVVMAGVLRSTAQLPAWSDDAQKAWWAANPTLKQEAAAAYTLQHQLALDYQKNGAAAFSQPDFQNWLDLYAWIKVGVESVDVLSKPENFQAFVAVGQDDTIFHLFVEKMEPDDNRPAALAILLRLALANLADLHRYAALGVAYSLVFDVPFPKDWPHDQVAQSAVPIGDLDPVARFQFYVDSNRSHKLELDLTQLSFENLKFLVDSEVSLSELKWGQGNIIPYTHFADAFFSIKYTTLRIGSGANGYDWNMSTYRLQDILEAGGICVDQAYYAYMVGKARGIPTVFLSGLGDEGGHAWFGYLDRSGSWELDCGRYEEQNYAKGYTHDPQTWQELKDTDLMQFVKNGVNDPSYPAARAALAWARLQGNFPAAKGAYEDAHTIMPNLAAVWKAEADYLDRTNASIDDQKTFYQAWTAQMAAFPDQKVAAQRRLVAELRKANDPSADSVEQDIILQNRTGGIDLAVDGTMEAIDDHFKARDWDGARMEYERSVRDFGDSGGGTFYFRVVEPYIYKCWEHGQVEQAKNGIMFTDDRTKLDKPTWRGPSTINNGFDDLKKRQTAIDTALAAMLTWLGEIDGGQTLQAWNEGSPHLHSTPSDPWRKSVDDMRRKAGSTVTSRVVDSVAYHENWHSPDGNQSPGPFVAVQFLTTCDKGTIEESVLFQKTGEHEWQAFAYGCQPAAPAPAAAGSP